MVLHLSLVFNMAKDKNHKGKYSHTGGNSRPLRGTVYFKNGKWYKKVKVMEDRDVN